MARRLHAGRKIDGVLDGQSWEEDLFLGVHDDLTSVCLCILRRHVPECDVPSHFFVTKAVVGENVEQGCASRSRASKDQQPAERRIQVSILSQTSFPVAPFGNVHLTRFHAAV